MVIGNGLLANAFAQYIDNSDILIFASGVSNSKETRHSEFDRELTLIKKSLKENCDKKIIYFSTCSIYDVTLLNTEYVNHKLKIESFICDNFKNFIIFRLPIVVGSIINQHTMFNFFKSKLVKNEDIMVQEDAYRYLIDIADISSLLPYIIDVEEFNGDIIDVCFDNKIKVSNLVQLMKDHLGSYSKIRLIEGGSGYCIDNSKFLHIIEKNNFLINESYNYYLVEKNL